MTGAEVINPGTARVTGHHQNLETARKGPPLEPQERTWPGPPLLFLLFLLMALRDSSLRKLTR